MYLFKLVFWISKVSLFSTFSISPAFYFLISLTKLACVNTVIITCPLYILILKISCERPFDQESKRALTYLPSFFPSFLPHSLSFPTSLSPSLPSFVVFFFVSKRNSNYFSILFKKVFIHLPLPYAKDRLFLFDLLFTWLSSMVKSFEPIK